MTRKRALWLDLLVVAIALFIAFTARAAEPPVAAFAQVRDGSTPVAVLDLGGRWEFKATGGDKWLPAQVPSTVHTDLIRAGKLEDPFYRDNELKAQWVERKDWEYRRVFNVNAALLARDRIFLECRGLDTIAEIWLNGTPVASTTNMFIEYEFDVKPLLREGKNELRIILRSILDWIQKQKVSDPKARMLCPEGHSGNDCRKGLLFFARKESSDFGWDWSLRTVTSGIWKPIRLVAYDAGRIVDLVVRQDLSQRGEALLDVTARVEQFGGKNLDLRLEAQLDGKMVAGASAPVDAPETRKQLSIRNPRLWWPNGWGEHPLYVIVATLREGKKVIHEKRLRIGLRTVELVREQDERGESFGFRVNEHAIFCKGANWIPLDALPDRLAEEHYRLVLRSVVEANMNMLRVWGGGLYEADIFYEVCDENGIMVWHDFMFASGPYVANPSFLENVRSEIENVVRRRRHHPSIVLWCGNNEQESGMVSGPRWLEDYKTLTWEDYDKIFHEVVPHTAARHDPDRPYWPSSPHRPLDRERKTANPESASGDAHDWDVWHGGKSFAWFDQLSQFRFVSEFGFESLPSMETIRSFTLAEDRFFNSYILEHHEKTGLLTREGIRTAGHNRGMSRLAQHAAALFRMPSDLEDWVYISQLMQGEGVRMGSEALRRNYPKSTGALYWQLGDNWPVISNSSIDYYGRWKALHFMARRFFSPVMASVVVSGTEVQIWGVNDRRVSVPAVLEWVLARFDGAEVKRGTVRPTLPPNCSTLVAELSFAREVGEDPALRTYRNESFANGSQHYLFYRLVHNGEELSSNVAFFVPYKYLQLPEPGLEVELSRQGHRTIATVSARRFAAFVELGLKEGYARFSDNYFHLLPGTRRRIEVIDFRLTEEELKKQLYVRSLAGPH